MSKYNHGSDDNQKVHTNSGIPNKAFFLTATGVGGNAWKVQAKFRMSPLRHLPKRRGSKSSQTRPISKRDSTTVQAAMNNRPYIPPGKRLGSASVTCQQLLREFVAKLAAEVRMAAH
jgi:hypothetical protein